MISIKEFKEKYDSGVFDSPDVKIQINAGWHDWFCKDTSLANKTKKLAKKLFQLIKSDKIDIEKTSVIFVNKCPMWGNLYDCFYISDLETKKILYMIVPASGHKDELGISFVYTSENNYVEPIVKGSWSDVKKYFRKDI